MTPAYLNVHGAAAHLGVSASYLNSLRVRGGGPRFCKVGRLVRYSVEALDQFMQARMVASTSQRGDGA